VLGFFFYVAVAALSFTKVFAPSQKMLGLLRRIAAGLTGLGFVISLYFVYIQFFEIQTLCSLCLGSAILVTILFVLQGVEMIRPVANDF
jgi:uncharacterized membrane protein